jgi:hypothetical protein
LGSVGTPTAHPVTIPTYGAPPVPNNSEIQNNAGINTPFTIEVNGVQVASGSVNAGAVQHFNVNDVNDATVALYTPFVRPTYGRLISNGITYFGIIQGNYIGFVGVNLSRVDITNGVVIEFN